MSKSSKLNIKNPKQEIILDEYAKIIGKTPKQEIILTNRFDARIKDIGALLRRKSIIMNSATIALCATETYLLESNLRLGVYDPLAFERFSKIPAFLKRQRRRIKRPTTLALFDRDIALILSLVAETLQRWSYAQETKIHLLSTLQHFSYFYESMQFSGDLWISHWGDEPFWQFVKFYDEFIDVVMLTLDSRIIVAADLDNFLSLGREFIVKAKANSYNSHNIEGSNQLEEALLNLEVNVLLING